MEPGIAAELAFAIVVVFVVKDEDGQTVGREFCAERVRFDDEPLFVERMGHAHLLVDGQGHRLPAHPVAEGRVVEEDRSCHRERPSKNSRKTD